MSMLSWSAAVAAVPMETVLVVAVLDPLWSPIHRATRSLRDWLFQFKSDPVELTT